MELYLDPIRKVKRSRPTIAWTQDMTMMLHELFPITFNNELVKQLGVSQSSLIRKARQLGIYKEHEFLQKRRNIITKMAVEAHPPHPHKGDHTWYIPNSEHTRFKNGCSSVMARDPEIVKKVHLKRNQTIKRERTRIKIDLPPLTKLNIRP